jgi:FkbM family methyltransferase
VFHRLFLRDEYKILDTPPDNLGCVIDIGGHIGTFSFLIAPFAHRVLVFEPVSENYHLLKRNLSGKRFGHVRCVNAAVSDRKKEIKIYISSMGSGSHSTHESVGEEFEVVPALSLEDIFTEYNIERCDLLKIDCEGSEYEILFSTGKDVMSRISRIVLEYHKIQSRESHWNCDSLRENLEANGFEVTMKRSKRKPGQGIMLCDRRGFSNP